MDPNDTMYEIATTDAWRSLIHLLEGFQVNFEKQLIMVCRQPDFAHEAARHSGRVEAVEMVLQELKSIGAKKDA